MPDAPETRYVKSGDVHIAYQVFGEGPRDLVFLSNWDNAIDVLWDEPAIARFFEQLASFGRVILFDKRGTGVSDGVSLQAVPTLESWVDDVQLVMDAVRSQRAAILACTFSGPLGILFAATCPERTSALVLTYTYARLRIASDYSGGMPDADVDEFLAAIEPSWGVGDPLMFYAPSVAGDQRLRRWWNRSARLALSPAAAAAFSTMMAETDVRSILSSIQAPTLVVHARGRPEMLYASRHLAEHIPAAKLLEVDGIDILPWLNDSLAGDIQEFLTGARREPDSHRVLATVVFTDLVGSTQRAAELGDQAWRGLLDDYEARVETLVDRFQGRWVKSTGDGTLATFDGPARAVRFAQSLTNSVRDLGLNLRSGVHTGEIQRRADDVAGIAVHIGQRVSDLARTGEVLVSRTVVDLVAGSGIEFLDRGEHDLKGIPGTWRLYAAAG